jgi:hypothetical protein
MKKATEKDFKNYKMLATWNPLEAVALINSLNPKTISLPIPLQIEKHLEAIKRAIDSGELKRSYSSFEDYSYLKIIPEFITTDDWEGISYHQIAHLNVIYFLKWATKKGFTIPQELDLNSNLDGFSMHMGNKEEMPPYLDPNHKFFSEEIEIAISAWMSLYNDSTINIKKSHKQQIKDWLRKNHDQLSKNSIERIAILVNPNKKGGVPPTNEQ